MPVLSTLAAALSYPDPDYPARLEQAAELTSELCPEAGERLSKLIRTLSELSLGELEERYTRTFDLSPDCALEVGWHLYGEDYKRGAFLVRARGLLEQHGVVEAGELPDHLVHLLPLLAVLPEDEARELASGYVLPAVEKMRAVLVEKENPFAALVEAVEDVLIALYMRQTEESLA